MSCPSDSILAPVSDFFSKGVSGGEKEVIKHNNEYGLNHAEDKFNIKCLPFCTCVCVRACACVCAVMLPLWLSVC